MEKRRVVITGMGAVTPIGNTVQESWQAAKEGKCGIGPITRYDNSAMKVKLAGEVKGLDIEPMWSAFEEYQKQEEAEAAAEAAAQNGQ